MLSEPTVATTRPCGLPGITPRQFPNTVADVFQMPSCAGTEILPLVPCGTLNSTMLTTPGFEVDVATTSHDPARSKAGGVPPPFLFLSLSNALQPTITVSRAARDTNSANFFISLFSPRLLVGLDDETPQQFARGDTLWQHEPPVGPWMVFSVFRRGRSR